ncbi:hypothetical protein HOG21_08635 [bacterium]|nr:hypothetical protein [bacterium]
MTSLLPSLTKSFKRLSVKPTIGKEEEIEKNNLDYLISISFKVMFSFA